MMGYLRYEREGSVTLGQLHLSLQDLTTLDVTRLTPLSHEVISRQATINIGTIGHVAHGKSTVVKAISGVHTVRFKNELERNITIKLGYANAKVCRIRWKETPFYLNCQIIQMTDLIFFTETFRFTNLMMQVVLGQNAIDLVEVVHLMSFLQTFQEPKGTSN